MLTCLRCGDRVPRLTVAQSHCLTCAREVAALVVADTKRRAPRFPAKDWSSRIYAR